MAKIIVYHKPTCSTSRKVVKAIADKGLDYEIVKYYETPFTKSQLKDLLRKMGKNPSDLLRKKEKLYKELVIKNQKFSENQILSLLVNNPDLIERPIVQRGAKVILARPPEKIYDLI